MRARKKTTATQVTPVTNSYISPPGTRCTASPRVSTPVRCTARPRAFSARATRTQRPAGTQDSRLRSPRPGTPGGGAPSADPGPAATGPAATDPVGAGPAASPGPGGRTAVDGCRPNAKSPA